MHEVEIPYEDRESFDKIVSTEAAKGDTFVYLLASRTENGQSWCPDCRSTEPLIRKILGEVAPNATFIAVEAGPKPAWKSPDAFYRHSSTKATAVPTLYKWGTAAKLVDVPDCLNEAKIRSLASA